MMGFSFVRNTSGLLKNVSLLYLFDQIIRDYYAFCFALLDRWTNCDVHSYCGFHFFCPWVEIRKLLDDEEK